MLKCLVIYVSLQFHEFCCFSLFLPQFTQLQYQIPYQQQAIQYNRPQAAPPAKQTLALTRRPPPQQINYQAIQPSQSNKDEEEREEDYEVSK